MGAIGEKDVSGRWPGLKTIVEITSTIDYGDKTAITKRFYISDEDFPKAAYFNMLARGHWSIENQLHWIWTSHSKKMHVAREKDIQHRICRLCAKWQCKL